MAVELGIAKKSGAWFTYDGEQLGQGRENAKQFLAENTEVMVQMADRVRQQSMPVVEAPADASSDAVSAAAAKATAAKPAAEKSSKKAFTAKDDEPIEL
ncbi:MAG: hypothetical protein EB050_06745 [Actinobacteria bacterium]|nr:hypothetical protein [Actinomycetota bacterium]